MARNRDDGARAELEVEITALGARGDGVAALPGDDGKLHVPLTLPGDRVRVCLEPARGGDRRGRVVAWLARGPDLTSPVCRHFGRCGGCTLQHFGDPGYGAWKSRQVTAALARAGFPVGDSLPLVRTEPGGRRRAAFTVRGRGGVVTAGFLERLSHRLVDIEECPVLAPGLPGLLPVLRRRLGPVLARGGEVEVLAARLEGGVDVVLVGPGRLDLAARQALAGLAEEADLARLSWRPGAGRSSEPGLEPVPEPVAARRPVFARFGSRLVAVPPGAFLQASREGEEALVRAVLAGVGEADDPVADLFAGCGTFSVPLALGACGRRRVLAVDGNPQALAALAAASRDLPGLTTRVRDLGRDPLSPRELAPFRAVVFDPPRAGAGAQAAALAAASVPTVIAVSCNPATFSRDARVLAQGGYRLVSALAVDQFLWSAHVELVAVFRR